MTYPENGRKVETNWENLVSALEITLKKIHFIKSKTQINLVR